MSRVPAKCEANAVPSWSDRSQVNAILKRANDGDRSVIPALRTLFTEADRDETVFEAYGSPPKWLIDELVKKAAGTKVSVEEATRRMLEECRLSLEGPSATPIERLLAQRAAICWFLVHRYEAIYSAAKDLTIKQADFHQRRIERAHRQLLSALKTLATVRKLAIPALQVNIGTNQLNSQSPRSS